MNLKGIRNKRGLTQKQLSKLSGVMQATISVIECGVIKSPRWEVAYKLSKALRVRPESLFPGAVQSNNELIVFAQWLVVKRKRSSITGGEN